MEKEYSIKVSMTPHPWDCAEEPYFWVIFEGNCNAGCGWSKSPEEAWEAALKYHRKYHIEQE